MQKKLLEHSEYKKSCYRAIHEYRCLKVLVPEIVELRLDGVAAARLVCPNTFSGSVLMQKSSKAVDTVTRSARCITDVHYKISLLPSLGCMSSDTQ